MSTTVLGPDVEKDPQSGPRRDYYRRNALALVAQDQFRWENIGQRFAEVLDGIRKPSMSMSALDCPSSAKDALEE